MRAGLGERLLPRLGLPGGQKGLAGAEGRVLGLPDWPLLRMLRAGLPPLLPSLKLELLAD